MCACIPSPSPTMMWLISLRGRSIPVLRSGRASCRIVSKTDILRVCIAKPVALMQQSAAVCRRWCTIRSMKGAEQTSTIFPEMVTTLLSTAIPCYLSTARARGVRTRREDGPLDYRPRFPWAMSGRSPLGSGGRYPPVDGAVTCWLPARVAAPGMEWPLSPATTTESFLHPALRWPPTLGFPPAGTISRRSGAMGRARSISTARRLVPWHRSIPCRSQRSGTSRGRSTNGAGSMNSRSSTRR